MPAGKNPGDVHAEPKGETTSTEAESVEDFTLEENKVHLPEIDTDDRPPANAKKYLWRYAGSGTKSIGGRVP